MRRNVPKVTVVVPVYKVEKYLEECVDSILRQTLKNIEVILVDDGSPDKCGKIIDAYAKKDKRVVPIHQKNAGYSAAVNRGIKLAKGEYIGIIESDDWIEPDMFELLYKNAKKNKTDITKGMFYIYNSTAAASVQNVVFKNASNVDLSLAPDGPFSAADWPKILAFHASIWSSIYRASFIKKLPIPESAGASYQDFPFMVKAMTAAKRISVVKRPFVHWRNDPAQGNSTSANGKKLLMMAQNTKLAIESVRQLKNYPTYKEALFVHAFWANYGFFERIEWKYKKDYFKMLQEIFAEIKDDPDFKFSLFTPADLYAVKIFLAPYGYSKYKIRRCFYRLHFGLLRIARTFIPTYRTVTFIKEQNWNTQRQIEVMMSTIDALQKRIDQLEKK